MTNHNIFCSFVIFSLLSTLAFTKVAVCVLNTPANITVSGFVRFEQKDESELTDVTVEIQGLNPGKRHGFHIHEKADFTQGCVSAGAHYNPFENEHGAPEDENRHVGDLGNLQADMHGIAEMKYTDPVIQLYGNYSIIGRACVVHADVDDLGQGDFADSKTTGHAGARIACGKVELETSAGGNFFLKVLVLLGLGAAFYYAFIYRLKNRQPEDYY